MELPRVGFVSQKVLIGASAKIQKMFCVPGTNISKQNIFILMQKQIPSVLSSSQTLQQIIAGTSLMSHTTVISWHFFY
jgi:hypothetical protein